MKIKELFKIYILPFIVLTILMQFQSAFEEYALYSPAKRISDQMEMRTVQAKKEIAPKKGLDNSLETVTLTRTAISIYRGNGTNRELLHFGLPEYSFDWSVIGEYKFEVIPKGTPFQLLADGRFNNGMATLKKGDQLYYFKTSREEYSIYEKTKVRVYDGTMKAFLNPEYDRYAAELETKLLAGKMPIKISQCFAAFDPKYGRNISHYQGSFSLYQNLLDDFFHEKQDQIDKFGLKEKIIIADSYLRPISLPHYFLFCSQLEFKDLGAYVAFQNLPSLD